MWFGFNPGVNFCHFSTLLTLSFFKFSQVRHQLHRSSICIKKKTYPIYPCGFELHCEKLHSVLFGDIGFFRLTLPTILDRYTGSVQMSEIVLKGLETQSSYFRVLFLKHL